MRSWSVTTGRPGCGGQRCSMWTRGGAVRAFPGRASRRHLVRCRSSNEPVAAAEARSPAPGRRRALAGAIGATIELIGPGTNGSMGQHANGPSERATMCSASMRSSASRICRTQVCVPACRCVGSRSHWRASRSAVARSLELTTSPLWSRTSKTIRPGGSRFTGPDRVACMRMQRMVRPRRRSPSSRRVRRAGRRTRLGWLTCVTARGRSSCATWPCCGRLRARR